MMCGYMTTRRGFTLIELLIVVAIIAITMAASMTVLTGPAFERVRAEEQEAFESGSGVFFATLLRDAHNASSLTVGGGDRVGGGENANGGGNAKKGFSTLTFDAAAPSTETVVYAVNREGVLARSSGGRPATKLVPGVETFAAEELSTGSLWSVTLSGRLHGYGDGKFTTVTRRMDFIVGSAWTGGGA